MKRIFTSLLFCVGLITNYAQQIIVEIPDHISAGETLKINYEYSLQKAGKITSSIDLYDGPNWLSHIGYAELLPAKKGESNEGILEIKIPRKLKPSEDLKPGQAYKININLYQNEEWKSWKGAELEILNRI